MNPFEDVQENEEVVETGGSEEFIGSDSAFDFPDEADFNVRIYGKDYKISPKSLLICPEQWVTAQDSIVLDRAIEAGSSWRYTVFEAYLQAKITFIRFQEEKVIEWAPKRQQAEMQIFEWRKEQVERKLRTNVGSSATKDDIEAMMVKMYAGDWTDYKVEEAVKKAEIERLENLHDVIKRRIEALKDISDRMFRDKYK